VFLKKMSLNQTNTHNNFISVLDEKINFDTGNQQAALIVYSVFLVDVFLCFCISVCLCTTLQLARNRRQEFLIRLSVLEASVLGLPTTTDSNQSEELHSETEVRGIPVTDWHLGTLNNTSEDGIPSAPPISLLHPTV
jgi:hypothetical protein